MGNVFFCFRLTWKCVDSLWRTCRVGWALTHRYCCCSSAPSLSAALPSLLELCGFVLFWRTRCGSLTECRGVVWVCEPSPLPTQAVLSSSHSFHSTLKQRMRRIRNDTQFQLRSCLPAEHVFKLQRNRIETKFTRNQRTRLSARQRPRGNLTQRHQLQVNLILEVPCPLPNVC